MTIGEKIRTLRKQKGWSQEELAKKIFVSRQALSKWEQDAALPDTDNVVQLTSEFGVTTDYLLHDDYAADADVPAVKQTAEARDRRLTRALTGSLGVALLIFNLVALIAFKLIASLSFFEDRPSEYMLLGTDGEYHWISGIWAFASDANLTWLLWIFILGLLVSIALIVWALVQGRRAKRR